MNHRGTPSRDTGSVLPLVLVFVTVFALIVVGLAGLTRTNLRTNRVTRDHIDDLYARDAGLEFGIHRIASEIGGDPTLCGDSGSPAESLGSTEVNEASIDVECDVTVDGSLGGGGFEPIVYLTGMSPDSKSEGYFYFDETEGGTVNVDAKVYNEGKFYIKDAAGSIVDFGRSIEQHNPDCQESSPPGRMVHSGSPWDCTNPISGYPMDPMPTMWAPAGNAPGSTTNGPCRYYYPGRHSSVTFDLAYAYFASGVHYFENSVGTFDILGQLIGGEPGSEDRQISPAPACANDVDAWSASPATDPDLGDSGVVFIFEGDAAMKLPSAAGNRVELFTYRPSAAAPSVALDGYSIIAPTSNGATWSEHTKSILIETDSLEPSLMSIYGLVFAPENHLKLRLLTNNSAPTDESYMFSAGLIVASVELITSGLPSSDEIHFAGGPGSSGPATIVVEAENPVSGRRSVATLKYDPADTPQVAVLSWRATDDS